MTIRVFSFGGGVQSTAVLVMSAQGLLPYKQFIFSNVGDDSEHPDAINYIRNVAKPYAEANGLEIVEIKRKNRQGQEETLMYDITKESRSINLPVYLNVGGKGAPGNRNCTEKFKIKPVSKWIKQQGATADNPALVGIGISIDEAGRARDASGFPWQRLEYPLIAARMNRNDCINVVLKAGLPKPPKSSCYFCPFHTLPAWQELYDKHPDLFQKTVELEQLLNERRAMLGKDSVYFTRYLKPLDQVVDGSHQNQLSLFQEEPDDRHSCGPFVCSNPF
jgi:hypothetical protein